MIRSSSADVEIKLCYWKEATVNEVLWQLVSGRMKRQISRLFLIFGVKRHVLSDWFCGLSSFLTWTCYSGHASTLSVWFIESRSRYYVEYRSMIGWELVTWLGYCSLIGYRVIFKDWQSGSHDTAASWCPYMVSNLLCFPLYPYMEGARGHVTTALSRDLIYPIYGHVGAPGWVQRVTWSHS